MSSDRLRVVGYAVSVTQVTGEALSDLKARVRVYEQEIAHMATAVTDLKRALDAKSDSTKLATALLNSRNWAASATMSHCYIEGLLGANPGRDSGQSYLIARFKLYDLFQRAAQMGYDDAVETRKRLNVRPTDVSAQVKWDGHIAP
jgi:hypothetical protein